MMPNKVRELVLEAISNHNDDWTKELCRERLREIKEPEVKKEVDLIMRREKGNDYRI
jgi:hypothetical protein